MLLAYKGTFYRREYKHIHRKIVMTHTQTNCPNRIALHAGKKGHVAEIEALIPVIEKSAIKLKLKQKFLKCKAQYKEWHSKLEL